MAALPRGVRHMPAHLSHGAQKELVEAIRDVVRAAPLYVPAMPGTGKLEDRADAVTGTARKILV